MKLKLPSFCALLCIAAAGIECIAVEPAKPIKVFILAGQSNMEGQGMIAADPKRNGGKGSLEFLVKEPSTATRFGHLVDKAGNWIVRDDVWISYLERQGALTVGYGPKPDRIGPELGFGIVVGDAFPEPILLIKCAWGGKSLAVDFRPPSSGKIPYSLGEKQDAGIAADPNVVGRYYREMLLLTKATLGRVKEIVPGSDGSYEIAGFGWHQGWNDRINDKFNAEYEANMGNLIRDIRHDLGIEAMPFVIAETGMSGPEEKHPRALSLMKAQAAVAEQPSFKGNVAFVGTKAFWRPQEVSPSNQGYHWNTNAETYYLIGQAMGEAMVKLIGSGTTQTPAPAWEPHDLDRPKPQVRDPGPGTEKEFAKPPSDAVVLFDGKDLSKWVRRPGAKEQPPVLIPKWKIGDGYFEVVANSGNIYSKDTFEDCRIHLEWATPAEFKPNAKGQNRGNSGLFLLGHRELQILDSFENETYADGQAAAVYGKYPPLFNVSRKPGEWQSYDITLEQPRFDENHNMTKPCTLTVFHNGVLVQDHVVLGGNATSGALGLQDHYTPVRFRNIWVQKLTPQAR